MNVKKLIAISTICAAMLCTGTYITAAADTTDGITIPDSFVSELTLSSVTDYAVGENQYAFASGNDIYIYTVNAAESSAYEYTDGELTVYNHTAAIVYLEYSDGNLYFSDGSTYIYSDGAITAAEFTFTAYDDSAAKEDGDYWYYINGTDLIVYNWNNPARPIIYGNNTYSKIKYTGNCYYVLKDSQLCALTNGNCYEISFSYEDCDNIEDIATAGTAQALSEIKNAQTAVVTAGARLIKVNANYLGEDYFTVSSVTFAEDNLTAQVLYMPDEGNAALIAIGTKTYLTLKTNLTTVTTYSAASVSSQSYYLLDNASVYVIPFDNDYTKIADVSKDTVVNVTGYVSGDVFDYNYYKVEYTEGGETISGYIVANMLTLYTFENDNYEANTIEDGDQSYSNNILTIVLVMIIVVLVLIAAGYLTFVTTSDKKKRRKKSR